MAKKIGCKKGSKVHGLLEEYRGVPEGLSLFCSKTEMEKAYQKAKKTETNLDYYRYYNITIL